MFVIYWYRRLRRKNKERGSIPRILRYKTLIPSTDIHAMMAVLEHIILIFVGL